MPPRILIPTDSATRLCCIPTTPRPSTKTLDIPTVLRYNDSIVRNKEENEMLVLECFAVLVTIAILITPAPEVE